MPPINLPNLGIEGLDIDGTMTPLREVPGAPIVFLIDEHHGHPVVEQNIAIAELIVPKRVAVIGVESHWAYVADITDDADSRANEDPRFAFHFRDQGRFVVGVESEQLYEVQRKDVQDGLWPDLRTHPFNFLRSHFFLLPLFRAWRMLGKRQYHLLLNVGKQHNDHIAKMIERGEIDEIASEQASYVRIRGSHFPEGE